MTRSEAFELICSKLCQLGIESKIILPHEKECGCMRIRATIHDVSPHNPIEGLNCVGDAIVTFAFEDSLTVFGHSPRGEAWVDRCDWIPTGTFS